MAEYKNPYLRDLSKEELEIYEKTKPLLNGISYKSFCKVYLALKSQCSNQAIISI
ncbi:hypothetical protein [uncultured Chryseobacterium sp.]|uniref:hypothetical protein n=1 Tax=uncultured Chryseobacterium sp. TaxID=259322 RepID=UPI0025853484|nr:hypothetical protein [uncultured Chryseobacterium sp.]